jgi:branched-chain amino acid transport system permease protein
MAAPEQIQRLLRNYWTPAALVAGLASIAALNSAFGDAQTDITLTEMLIRVVIVVGMAIFIGNSGILSFGHVGFMCIGAYGAAWASTAPIWKGIALPGLPDVLLDRQYPFLVAVLGGATLSAAVALMFGAMIVRLSGIAASIATFAFLVIVNSVYSHWDSVTAGTSSIIGIPTVVGPWPAMAFVATTVLAAHRFWRSGWGLLLRASKGDEFAARSSAVNILRIRLIAFVVSAFFVGVGGGLYAHFLGVLTVDVFYLDLTFTTLAMLVLGGAGSVTGGVIGVVSMTLVIEALRRLETGVPVPGASLSLPHGSQEIGLGVVLILILIFRPRGIMRGHDVPSPFGKT